MDTPDSEVCCPRFNPVPWDEQEVTWLNKRFVRDRVTSLFHLPLNYGAVMTRNDKLIRAADAYPATMLTLTDENSLWGADVYIEVSKDIANAHMASLSGTFLTKVFEGPFRNMRVWIEEMQAYVAAKGQRAKKLYFYYTTCPKCAKKYGENYVVILAEVDAG